MLTSLIDTTSTWTPYCLLLVFIIIVFANTKYSLVCFYLLFMAQRKPNSQSHCFTNDKKPIMIHLCIRKNNLHILCYVFTVTLKVILWTSKNHRSLLSSQTHFVSYHNQLLSDITLICQVKRSKSWCAKNPDENPVAHVLLFFLLLTVCHFNPYALYRSLIKVRILLIIFFCDSSIEYVHHSRLNNQLKSPSLSLLNSPPAAFVSSLCHPCFYSCPYMSPTPWCLSSTPTQNTWTTDSCACLGGSSGSGLGRRGYNA